MEAEEVTDLIVVVVEVEDHLVKGILAPTAMTMNWHKMPDRIPRDYPMTKSTS